MPISTFDKICSEADARSAATALAIPAQLNLNKRSVYFMCPQCDETMARMNYAHRSGVITDICRLHGIWLDRSELQMIIEFIDSGGLDRARQLEAERNAADRRTLDFARRTERPIHGSGGSSDWTSVWK